MLRFRRMRTLQKFASVHASVHNHFNQERHLYSRANFKLNRIAALAEWRQLGTALREPSLAIQRLARIRLTPPKLVVLTNGARHPAIALIIFSKLICNLEKKPKLIYY